MRLLLATSSCHVWFSSAGLADLLNQRIAASDSGVFQNNGRNNRGVMVRTPDFFDDDPPIVVPGTLWHNDIYAPSQMYPTISSPWCPNSGYDGFYPTDGSCDDEGPWAFATVAVVIDNAMKYMFDDIDNFMHKDWASGVFYASDANSCDQRCVYREADGGYDCPGGWIDSQGTWTADKSWEHKHKGAGYYGPGNPDKKGLAHGGGGAGCHFDKNQKLIDQVDATGTPGNIVQDRSCQCNYNFKEDWGEWVGTWTWKTQQKPGFEDRHWLDGEGKLAPAWGVDTAACWVNNPRDMIQIQNQLYWQRTMWNNQMVPETDWEHKSEDRRKYWGWNEIPVANSVVSDSQQWDAIIVKLPADICNDNLGANDHPGCLSDEAGRQLEEDLDNFIKQNNLVPGKENMKQHPGSDILFVREHGTAWQNGGDSGVNWSRHFFCQGWISPNNKYQIVNENGECYIDHATSFSDLSSIESSGSGLCLTANSGQEVTVSRCNGQAEQKWTFSNQNHIMHQQLCLETSGATQGSSLQLSQCNAHQGKQKWNYDGAILKSSQKCLDVWGVGSDTQGVQIWECNGHDNQQWTRTNNMGNSPHLVV